MARFGIACTHGAHSLVSSRRGVGRLGGHRGGTSLSGLSPIFAQLRVSLGRRPLTSIVSQMFVDSKVALAPGVSPWSDIGGHQGGDGTWMGGEGGGEGEMRGRGEGRRRHLRDFGGRRGPLGSGPWVLRVAGGTDGLSGDPWPPLSAPGDTQWFLAPPSQPCKTLAASSPSAHRTPCQFPPPPSPHTTSSTMPCCGSRSAWVE